MNFPEVKRKLETLSPVEGLRLVSDAFGKDAKFSSSFGMEDQVIAHWIGHEKLDIEVFTLDTGRLFQETYDLMAITASKYQLQVRTFYPDTKQVEQLVSTKGPNSFFDSVDNRKECCHIRKVVPLKRALEGARIWITGIRADQSGNRQSMELVGWDEGYQLIKYNPLLNWSIAEVEDFIAANKIPVNSLHRRGFPSIGCAPCTRAIAPGEDLRAGRWWWETSAKECGLHSVEDKEKKNVVG